MFMSLDGCGPQTGASISSEVETDEVLETFLNQISMETTFPDVSILIVDLEQNNACMTGLMILNH